ACDPAAVGARRAIAGQRRRLARAFAASPQDADPLPVSAPGQAVLVDTECRGGQEIPTENGFSGGGERRPVPGAKRSRVRPPGPQRGPVHARSSPPRHAARLGSRSEPAVSSAQPNVLLLVLDAARRDALEPYGAPAGATPNISALARRGHALAHAYSTASWTLPSHASLFTGLLPRALGLGQAPGGTPTGSRPVLEG